MSGYTILSLQQILDRFADLRQAPLGGSRAPHKPLLILLMLGRYQRGERGAVQYSEIRGPLAGLVLEFGPATKGAPNTEDPFWRLQNDPGKVWLVRDSAGGTVSEETGPPPISRLIDRKAAGNFPPDISRAFEAHPEYIRTLAAELLATHFPPSLHDDICQAVGLQMDGEIPGAKEHKKAGRDPEFRARILTAYGYRCAVTGWDLRAGHSLAGLEAAHIKWHTAGGPPVEQNGIALNSLLHKLFDLGVFTLSLDEEVPLVLISRLANGGEAMQKLFLDYNRKPICPPQDTDWLPDKEYIRWHQKEVFKGDPRR